MLLNLSAEVILVIIEQLPARSVIRLAQTHPYLREVVSLVRSLNNPYLTKLSLQVVLNYIPQLHKTNKILLDCTAHPTTLFGKVYKFLVGDAIDHSHLIKRLLRNTAAGTDLTLLNCTLSDIRRIAKLNQGIFRIITSFKQNEIATLIIDHRQKLVCYNRNMRKFLAEQDWSTFDPLMELLTNYLAWPENIGHAFESRVNLGGTFRYNLRFVIKADWHQVSSYIVNTRIRLELERRMSAEDYQIARIMLSKYGIANRNYLDEDAIFCPDRIEDVVSISLKPFPSKEELLAFAQLINK